MATKITFPFTVKSDSCSVTIYREKRGKYELFRLRWYRAGEKREESKSTFEAAKERAEEVCALITTGKANATDLSATDREIFAELKALVQPTGLSLVQVVHRFMDRWEPDLKETKVSDAFIAFTEEKKGTGDRHKKDIEIQLGKFSSKFGDKLISDLKQEEVIKWIESFSINPRTRNNYLNMVRGFFNFAQKKKMITRKEPHVLKDVGPYKGKPVHKNHLIAASDLRRLFLEVMKRRDANELILTIALQCWGGARRAEFKRLTWENVLYDGDKLVSVAINSDQAKTESRRPLHLHDSLRAVFEYVERKKSGPLAPYVDPIRCVTKLASRIGIVWPENCLRHGFITHLLTTTEDVNKVMYVAGTSLAMINKNYKELSTPTEAKEWFAVADIFKRANNANVKLKELKESPETEVDPVRLEVVRKRLKSLVE